ncbi:MAG: hypothetical protein WAM11_05320 [Cyanobium sp.]
MSCHNPPVLLAACHQLAGFRCRSEEQTAWLVKVARQAHGTGTTRVFIVLTEPGILQKMQLKLIARPLHAPQHP